MLRPKKNSCKEFDNEKKFLQLENSPPPPITFLMVRPLAGEKATYLKCGRFDVACSRRKLRSRHYLYFYVY